MLDLKVIRDKKAKKVLQEDKVILVLKDQQDLKVT